MNTLDVTIIEPRLKHPTIFEKFDALEPGEALMIHNDHDPLPLYYQMLAERGPVFEWEYFLKGPEIFEVKITKLAKDKKSSTIGELVAKDYRKAEVFKKFGIDFCCGGGKTVKEVCAKKGIDAESVEAELRDLDTTVSKSPLNFDSWTLDFLAQYIVNQHHTYVKRSIPLLVELSQKVARVHGAAHPEVVQINECFHAVANELVAHMYKEEEILFPYIEALAQASRSENSISRPGFGSVQNPIRMMEHEHENAGLLLKEIETLSNHYTPPQEACNSYRVLYGKLQEFTDDLHQHIHLENNILFPKAIALESKFVAQ